MLTEGTQITIHGWVVVEPRVPPHTLELPALPAFWIALTRAKLRSADLTCSSPVFADYALIDNHHCFHAMRRCALASMAQRI